MTSPKKQKKSKKKTELLYKENPENGSANGFVGTNLQTSITPDQSDATIAKKHNKKKRKKSIEESTGIEKIHSVEDIVTQSDVSSTKKKKHKKKYEVNTGLSSDHLIETDATAETVTQQSKHKNKCRESNHSEKMDSTNIVKIKKKDQETLHWEDKGEEKVQKTKKKKRKNIVAEESADLSLSDKTEDVGEETVQERAQKTKKKKKSVSAESVDSSLVDKLDIKIEHLETGEEKAQKHKKKKKSPESTESTLSEKLDIKTTDDVVDDISEHSKKSKKKHKKRKNDDQDLELDNKPKKKKLSKETNVEADNCTEHGVHDGGEGTKKYSKQSSVNVKESAESQVEKVHQKKHDKETKNNNVSSSKSDSLDNKCINSSSTSTHAEDPLNPVVENQWKGNLFNNTDRQTKFLRLMGGMKKEQTGQAKKGLYGSLSSLCSKTESQSRGQIALSTSAADELNQKLEDEYNKALNLKLSKKKGTGFGFTPDPAEGKKFHIDINKTNSIQFDD
ncbi:lysine-rich nucleolar protein 1-like [Biomphalaria glabrata]|uniref:Lysine-rich nucleolar protein 1-like n=1 Tax=Biomphalaria glabrata TaxID=6526 RepID=A0A9W2Z0I6_BIOGL|nr:lysine-rich nucleolar protein 1-like [Biomphalaria glabrata]XP_055868400.1 lysine-rich nucleolar protein 1-like [Biomphalaria glabrata]XP_055868463.1 lysine-rich nucleolar protein 1-like [Biomphalaria glabrata]XP_055868515.1 lysine-rich nucleolar protein 1-like [Biomphalaria glabrata]